MARKPFTDSAGFTRHCWECRHAKDWHKGLFYVDIATCELTGQSVEKVYSPDNQCSQVGPECDYETGGKR